MKKKHLVIGGGVRQLHEHIYLSGTIDYDKPYLNKNFGI